MGFPQEFPSKDLPSPLPDPPSPGGDRDPEVAFHGEKRSNGTYASTTDPEALLGKRVRAKKQSAVLPAMS